MIAVFRNLMCSSEPPLMGFCSRSAMMVEFMERMCLRFRLNMEKRSCKESCNLFRYRVGRVANDELRLGISK